MTNKILLLLPGNLAISRVRPTAWRTVPKVETDMWGHALTQSQSCWMSSGHATLPQPGTATSRPRLVWLQLSCCTPSAASTKIIIYDYETDSSLIPDCIVAQHFSYKFHKPVPVNKARNICPNWIWRFLGHGDWCCVIRHHFLRSGDTGQERLSVVHEGIVCFSSSEAILKNQHE